MPRIHGQQQVGWWDGHAAPAAGPIGTSTTWAGVSIKFTVPGRVFGLQLYDASAGTSPFFGSTYMVLISDGPGAGDKWTMAGLSFGGTVAAKWHHLWLPKPYRVVTTDTYRLAGVFLGGGFYRTNAALTSAVTRNGIQFLSSWQTTSLDIGNATLTTNTNANALDVLFQAD